MLLDRVSEACILLSLFAWIPPSFSHVGSYECLLPELFKVLFAEIVEGVVCVVVHWPYCALFELVHCKSKRIQVGYHLKIL
jgi:hypothetical protein